MNNNENFIGPVNLGNPHEFSILNFAELIIKLTNSNSKIEFKELPKDDPVQREPNITLAKEKLNWEPTVDVETGLKLTIQYFENLLNK